MIMTGMSSLYTNSRMDKAFLEKQMQSNKTQIASPKPRYYKKMLPESPLYQPKMTTSYNIRRNTHAAYEPQTTA